MYGVWICILPKTHSFCKWFWRRYTLFRFLDFVDFVYRLELKKKARFWNRSFPCVGAKVGSISSSRFIRNSWSVTGQLNFCSECHTIKPKHPAIITYNYYFKNFSIQCIFTEHNINNPHFSAGNIEPRICPNAIYTFLIWTFHNLVANYIQASNSLKTQSI
jgi:hypothetical protein